MHRLMLVGIAAALATACAPHEDGESNEPEVPRVEPERPQPQPQPPEPVATTAKVSIASVQLVQDCPDQDATPADQGPAATTVAPAKAKTMVVDEAPQRAARGTAKPGYAPIRQPCTQSAMQLRFTGEDAPAKVAIVSVRMLTATGEKLGTLQARKPTAWHDGTYQPWDEMLPAEGELQASYKLSVPNWNDVQTVLGDRNPFETMFVLEVDVEIGGQRQTVRSPEFVRERPHVIVT